MKKLDLIMITIFVQHLRFDENGLGHTETLVTRIERVTDEDFLKDVEGFRDEVRVRTEHKKVDLEE